jgi:DNA mismatch endonuclease, patch repair protein
LIAHQYYFEALSRSDRILPVDTFSREKRSEIMRKVRSSNTAPELLVRRLLHGSGYRFKLYGSDLPGNPDIVLPKYKAIILVHGCFWHRHRRCSEATMPTSNVSYWEAKFARNGKRDRRIIRDLTRLGWRVITVWECQTKDPFRLLAKLKKALPRPYPDQKKDAVLLAAEAGGKYSRKLKRAL